MRHSLSLCTLFAAACVAMPLHAQPPLSRPSPELAAVDLRAADVRFLLDAAAAGATEVRAGELALQRSTDPAVRDYAQALVQDHARANARLLAIARAKGVAVPRQPTWSQQGMLDGLRGVLASDFDAQFLQRAGVNAHREAIGLFHAQALRPRPDQQLQRFADDTMPVLERHLRAAQQLLAQRQAASAGSTATPTPAAAGARETIAEAVQVVQAMKRDPEAAGLLARAQGILVLPDYRRAALGLGVRTGEGVLVTRHGADFSQPAFFHLGGLSVGLQAGVAAGDVVYLLMSDRAVGQFRSNRAFSLSAAAGLTFGTWSQRRQSSRGKIEDVLVWSGTRGAYVGGAFGISEVLPDRDANRAYYGRTVEASAILGGLVENPHPNVLARVLGA